ncbi:MAG TPA: outer membrane lipoprotein chaperone LolA [Nitrospirae bacterium]|nr:outer-membrane lipoprotein carrier protein precursor [bacterium BMS3Abin10]GBE38302.1 outer-membrane lipoprotein carrier protein precursor [bacterium BMS3Bbin08]HDO26435.1 outer membrane lipoprotein chaperone LolA [Nitrospirota bacterium]
MNKKSSIISISLLAVFMLSTISSASTVDTIVEKIQNKDKEIQNMRGTFLQTSYITDLDRVERYEGEFFVKKPSSMKWTYSKPRDEEITISGNTTWIYKRSEKQALRTTFSRDSYGQVPLALINSLGSLKNDFDIKLIKENTLELTPKNRMGFIEKILLETGSGDFPVKTFKIFDTHGNRILITLKDVRINPGLEDSFFMFKAPAGVEVFDFNP